MAGEGVWIAYYFDRSTIVPFGTEVAALRYAVERSMQVVFAHYGDADWASYLDRKLIVW